MVSLSWLAMRSPLSSRTSIFAGEQRLWGWLSHLADNTQSSFSTDKQPDWLCPLPKLLFIQFRNRELEGWALYLVRTNVGDGLPFIEGFWWGRSFIGGFGFTHECRWLWHHEDLRERESTTQNYLVRSIVTTSTVTNLLRFFFFFFLIVFLCTSQTYI